MTSDFNTKITKVKTALEAVFIKKADIKDNLTSTDTDKPLSAKQGKQLNNNKASITHTHGNLQNDGSVGTSNNTSKNVVTDNNGKITTEEKPNIPSASSTTPSADSTNGSYGSGTTYARADHQHPKSSLYAEANHNHNSTYLAFNDLDTFTELTDVYGLVESSSLSSVATSGSYNDLSNKPSIPVDVSDLTDTNDTPFTPKSHTHDDRYYTETEIDTALNGKQATLVSGTNIKTINNQSLLGNGDITVGDEVGSFTDLQALITNASSGDIIILDKDYQNTGNESVITINKSLTIQGNEHIIDANSVSEILNITGTGNEVIIGETVFINGKVTTAGGAIYNDSQNNTVTVNNCTFIGNQSTTGGGGALSLKDDIVNNCLFIGNTCSKYGGAILCNKNSVIKNCIFKNNTGQRGNDVFCSSSGGVIYNCDTISNNLYNTTNKPYLTDHQDISGKANINDLGNLAYEDDIDLSTHDVSELTDTSDTAFTPKIHSHSISDVTNLQTSLNGKINTSDIANNLTTSTTGQVLDASQGKWLNDNKASSTHTHGNINNDGTITTVKTIGSNTNVGADYFIIRDNNDSNSTKSANVLDVLNKIVLDLIDEGES